MPSIFLRAPSRCIGALLCAGMLLNACGSSSSGQETFYLARAINLVTDSPGQTIEIGNLSFQAAFGTGTGFSSAFAGSGEIEVRAFVPGANLSDPFEDTLVLKPAETVDFADGTSYTVINYGTVADFRSMTLATPVPDTIDTSVIQLQFVHAALGAGNVDIFVTVPDADLGSSTVTASLAVGETSALSTEAVGDYQIRLTSPGTTSVIYDSGTISPSTPGTRLFVIGRTTGPTSVPVFLSRWSSQGAPVNIGDINTPIFVRLLHLATATGALDLFAEDNFASPVASNTAFSELSAYGEARDTLPDGVTVLAQTPIDFSAGATDIEDGDLTAGISWTSSIDGPLSSGADISEVLSTGTHSIVATATDSGGLMGAATVRVGVFTSDNAAPFVDVISPQNGKEVTSGTPITFSATATDSEDGDLAASLTWASSIDGALIGSGSSITATLSPGIHAITASVADAEGVIGSDAVVVSVTSAGNAAPEVSISDPDFISAVELDVTLAGDPESVELQNAFELFGGITYTLLVGDTGGALNASILTDTAQRVATHSLLRIINVSDFAATVDVYVSTPGAGIAGATPFFTNIPPGFESGIGPVAAGDYDVTITTAGATDVLLLIPSITLANAQANIVALFDDEVGMQADYLRIIE